MPPKPLPSPKGKEKATDTPESPSTGPAYHPGTSASFKATHDRRHQAITAMMQESNEEMTTYFADLAAKTTSTPKHSAKYIQEREATIAQETPKRRNGRIDPNSGDFDLAIKHFTRQLAKDSVQEVLDEHFTPHERDLIMPADRESNKTLRQIQRHNRVKYSALMKTARFAKWRQEAGRMEVKLAVLWFGLPVAQVDYQPGDSECEGWDSESEEDEDVEIVGGYKHLKSDQPVGEPLKFLNSYQMRYFGDDNLRDEDSTYRGYYGFNQFYPVHPKNAKPLDVSFRGGGLEEELGDKETDDFLRRELPSVSLRGGGSDEDLSEMEVDDDFIQSELRDSELGDNTDSDAGSYDDLFEQEPLAPGSLSLRGGMPPKRTGGPSTAPAGSPEKPRTSTTGTRRASVRYPDLNPAAEEATEVVNPYIIQQPPPQYVPQQPPRGAPASMRERTYAEIPSVHTNNSIPVNAPPVEKILRFSSDSLPALSLSVLTPTEQRRLQVAYYEMRNVALERSAQCPYRGCNRVFALTEEDKLQKHLEDVHVSDQCNFCDEVLYKFWSKNERRAHFLGQHWDLFLTDKDWKADNSFNVPSLFRVNWERESRYKFCPRCSRDHGKLNAHADRTHHDNVCYPGSSEGPHDWVACGQCGGKKGNKSDQHQCQVVINPEEAPYCEKCALPAGLFSDLYRATHQMHCRGHSNEIARHCPWCGQNCGDPSNVREQRKHMMECVRCPDSLAQGPLNPETAEPWPFAGPYEPKEGKGIHKDPPTHCPECKEVVYHLDAHTLMKHIEDSDEDKLHFCLFCKLDYKTRGWLNDRKARVQHLDDHIHERKQTLVNELVQTRRWPENHPYTMRRVEAKDLEKLQVMRELEHKDWQHQVVVKQNEALVKELNEDKKKLQELMKQLREVVQARRVELPEQTPTPTTTSAKPTTSATKPSVKGKEKETPVTKPASTKPSTKPVAKPATKPKATTLTPPSTTSRPDKKRKHPTQPTAPVDPSYRPTAHDSDSAEEDPEFIAEEKIHLAQVKRQKTERRDPRFKAAGVGPEVEAQDEDEEPVSSVAGKKSGKGRISQKTVPPK